MPPAVKAWSLNHWTAREVPVLLQLNLFAYVYIYYSSLFPFFFYFKIFMFISDSYFVSVFTFI